MRPSSPIQSRHLKAGRLAWIAAVGASTLTVIGAAGFLKTRLECHPKSGGDLRMLINEEEPAIVRVKYKLAVGQERVHPSRAISA
jgi:hypothetical protein